MNHDRGIKRRKSIRLKNYDYTRAGLYFVTICVQNRECLFGEITNDVMVLNEAGEMVGRWFYELENKFPDLKCHEMIAMPNHIHFIIENTGPDFTQNPHKDVNVGEDLCVCPDSAQQSYPNKGEHTGSPLRGVVQWFKTMTTNEYIRGVKNKNWRQFDKKLWQRNYWERVVRNENEFRQISDYIKNNPVNWNDDKLNDGAGNRVMEPKREYKIENWMV